MGPWCLGARLLGGELVTTRALDVDAQVIESVESHDSFGTVKTPPLLEVAREGDISPDLTGSAVETALEPLSLGPFTESFEKAINAYRGLGLSDRRIASILIRCGHPMEWIRQSFPSVPVSELPQPRDASCVEATSPANSADEARPENLTATSQPHGISQPHGVQARRGRRSDKSRGIVPSATLLQSVLNRAASTAVTDASRVGVTSPQETASVDGAVTHRFRYGSAATSPRDSSSPENRSFQFIPLIQCTFPHGDPGNSSTFTRHNGRLELTFSTIRPEVGLPYGVPARLLTFFCTTEAVRNKSPKIELGPSIHEFLRQLDVPNTRGERGSQRVYANQLLRLIHCALTIDETIQDNTGRHGLDIKPTLFVDTARLWWDEGMGVGEGSYLVLSPAIFNSISTRAAPLSTQAIRALRKSPMDLDVYAWLVHRLFRLVDPSPVTWDQLFGQFGHSYGEVRYFRRFFSASLTRALREYPDARLKVSDRGILLLPSKPHVEPRKRIRA